MAQLPKEICTIGRTGETPGNASETPREEPILNSTPTELKSVDIWRYTYPLFHQVIRNISVIKLTTNVIIK